MRKSRVQRIWENAVVFYLGGMFYCTVELLLIDAAVERERLLRGGDAELPQRADDAVALRFAEVEQGIIKVQKQIADHGSSTFPFSCAQAAADMRRRRNTIRQPAQLSIMTGTPM